MPQLDAPFLLLASTNQYAFAAIAESTNHTPNFGWKIIGCMLLLGFQFSYIF
jgi:hypothetical protein